MTRKLSLPLISLGRPERAASAAAKPTVDAVRERLGGRASSEPGVGELVLLTTAAGKALPGVVLFRRGAVVDVWIDAPEATISAQDTIKGALPGHSAAHRGLVRRARPSDLAPLRAPSPESLVAVAADARVFAALSEGQRIRFQDGGDLAEGMLVEKCRFGGLVQRDDGIIVGVGFRRLWPAQAEGAPRN
ncbi:hypothetical protein BE21_38685 [Sorangium cellulosum]|uniref:Uncharacterized protein n=1 Tax=Sorangium cellulosum TaxID=56 RepID=A0A150TMR3_SORCE|nr:hypothetical protein BE21_38685 [Sorangium cellulosum]